MSQKSTVTCLISPGSVLTVPGGCGFGTYGVGAADSWQPCGSSEVPHCPQNLCPGGLAAPHDGQVEPSGAPHCPQNFMPAGLSALHRAHFITCLRAGRCSDGDPLGPTPQLVCRESGAFRQ